MAPGDLTATQIGEAFVGSGAHAAHLNTVLGGRGGPVESAWLTALAMPRPGHIPFVCVLRPGLPVKPYTLFVNKAPLAGSRHERLTWGAAQAGVASGTLWAVADDVVAAGDLDDLLLYRGGLGRPRGHRRDGRLREQPPGHPGGTGGGPAPPARRRRPSRRT